jgi:pimeloyl-ACP methyl ester carboxylesterase
MLVNGDILEDLKDWRRQLFILSGEQDQITPVPQCRAIAEATHQGRYVEIQAGGHAVYIDAPLRFNAILKEFMEEAHE